MEWIAPYIAGATPASRGPMMANKVLKSSPIEQELRAYADPLARIPREFMAGVGAQAVSVEKPATGKLVEREVS